MTIGILAWGSLVWDKRELPILDQWQPGGPVLPIEFSRISDDDRLTLVIDERNGVEVQTHFALSPKTDLELAINDLQIREKTSRQRIGFVDRTTGNSNAAWREKYSPSFERIRRWCDGKDLDAVIWTALGPKFKDAGQSEPFSPEAALRYVNGLTGETRAKAFEYIQNAPPEVQTPFRHLFKTQHG
jgi:hypothetical protein